MDFQKVINNILPRSYINNKIFEPSVTHSNGERQGFDAKRPGRIHGGVDFNYHDTSGNPVGQNGINLKHPAVGAPVSGYVSDTDPDWGKIEITDVQGFKHQILHLNSINAAMDDGAYVNAGQNIGNMGGRGPKKGADEYPQHVHYSIRTQDEPGPNGNAGDPIDPEDFWNNNLYYTVRSGYLNHIPLVPTNHLNTATQNWFKGLSQGFNILGNGETLRREGNQVWRIEKDGSTRGYFISE